MEMTQQSALAIAQARWGDKVSCSHEVHIGRFISENFYLYLWADGSDIKVCSSGTSWEDCLEKFAKELQEVTSDAQR